MTQQSANDEKALRFGSETLSWSDVVGCCLTGFYATLAPVVVGVVLLLLLLLLLMCSLKSDR